MNKKNLLIYIFLICSHLSVTSQYTELINSNRPGTSQGAFSVGNRVLQFEAGASKGWEEHRILSTETDAFTVDYSIRYGLVWEELEISFMGSYLSENITDFRNPNNVFEYKQSNFKSNTLGAKYLIYDPYKKRAIEKPNIHSWKANNSFKWRELIPAVALYAGANIDSEDNPFLPPDDPRITPKFLLSTQNNFEGGWVFVTNFIVDRITTDFPTYSYILTLTHAFNEKVSAFIENQGIKSDFYADQLLRFGGAYLFGKDLQLDALASINFKDTPSKFYVGMGVSYRFDFHTQDQYIEDESSRKRDKKDKRKDDFIDDDGGTDGK